MTIRSSVNVHTYMCVNNFFARAFHTRTVVAPTLALTRLSC